MNNFYDQYKSIKPWLQQKNPDPDPKKENLQVYIWGVSPVFPPPLFYFCASRRFFGGWVEWPPKTTAGVCVKKCGSSKTSTVCVCLNAVQSKKERKKLDGMYEVRSRTHLAHTHTHTHTQAWHSLILSAHSSFSL